MGMGGGGWGGGDAHHLVVVIQLEAELPLLGLRPPELGVASQGLLRELLLLILDEGFQRVYPLCGRIEIKLRQNGTSKKRRRQRRWAKGGA